MRTSAIDRAIRGLDDKMAVLRLAKAELEQARDSEATPDEPKAKRTRKRKGLPGAVPPASEANLTGKDGRL